MSDTRISRAFARLKDKGKKALIAFVTAGDPDIAATRELVLTLEASGADIIELGIPFSDPMADGPTIQASSERALKKGTTPEDVLDAVKKIRKTSEIPIVLFGYYNPIFSYGVKKFSRKAKEAGADGVLVVDLPAEEAGELKEELCKNGLDLIFLLTPTSDAERMKLTSNVATGFIYFISITGVTGARQSVSKNISSYVKKIRCFSSIPVVVGFGVSTPVQANAVSSCSDGAVVGSAIINVIAARQNDRKALLADVGEFVSSLKKGMNARG
ncbi:MAG: tryptophan synthase subunit alpha [Deltaproteobacteria bacterium]|nr:tryptophan synthase subunit alpha [Deltaproteobacteria bacterium]